MTQILAPGEATDVDIRRAPTNNQPGDIILIAHIYRDHDGVAFTFTHHNILNRTFTNLEEGRDYLRMLYREAKAGTPLWLIIERAGVWTSAAHIVDDAEQALIDSIRDTMLTANTRIVAEQAAVVADAQQIVTGSDWNQARQEARRIAAQAATKPRNIGAFRQGPANRRHSSEPPTAPMLRAVSLRNPAGEVHVQAGVSPRTLEGLEARGYGRLVRGTARRRFEIVKLVLNNRGLKLAATNAGQSEVAA